VADIFAKRGEAYFRSLERQVLAEQMAPRHLVVATGGGTFADVQNRAVINNDGVSVWLDVPLDRLIARVPAGGRRPLASDRAGFDSVAKTAAAWSLDILQPPHREWLAALPEGPILVDAVVEICHGSPFDEDAYVFDELDAVRALKVAMRPLFLFGHTHYPASFELSA